MDYKRDCIILRWIDNEEAFGALYVEEEVLCCRLSTTELRGYFEELVFNIRETVVIKRKLVFNNNPISQRRGIIETYRNVPIMPNDPDYLDEAFKLMPQYCKLNKRSFYGKRPFNSDLEFLESLFKE